MFVVYIHRSYLFAFMELNLDLSKYFKVFKWKQPYHIMKSWGNPRLGALKYLLIFIDSIIFYLLYWIHVIVLPRPGAPKLSKQQQQHVLRSAADFLSLSLSPSSLLCMLLLSSQHIKLLSGSEGGKQAGRQERRGTSQTNVNCVCS